MGGWIKFFLDGTKELGSDYDVRMKRASWSRGRLVGMSGASISYGRKMVTLQGYGEYWQSDDYEALIFGSVSSLKIRRIQKKIEPDDIWVYSVNNKIFVVQNIHRDPHAIPPEGSYPKRFTESDIGKWLTIEYDIEEDKVTSYLRDDRI